MGDTKIYDPKKSIQRARQRKRYPQGWKIDVADGDFVWNTNMERVGIIRERLPYEAIEFIGKKANMPVKRVLSFLGIPQTTFNKKLRERELLSRRDSELVVVLTELLDFGLSVFNDEEEKFHRWLKKPNVSLGGATPESLFDSLTGIQEVRNSLNRIEFGSTA